MARAKGLPRSRVAEEYLRTYMGGLQRIATVRKHTNVLQHAAGYLKKRLDSASRSELEELIHDYRNGLTVRVGAVGRQDHRKDRGPVHR